MNDELKDTSGFRWWVDRYGAHVGIAVVIALVLAFAPTSNPDRTNAFAGAGTGSNAAAAGGRATVPGASGGTAVDPATGQPVAVDPATGQPIDPATGQPAAPAADVAGASAEAAGMRVVGEDCARRAILGANFPCRPLVEGDNTTGATYQGVDEDSITVVYYVAASNEQVNAVVGGQGGYTTDPEVAYSMLEAYVEWFNENFQFWGRQIELEIFQSEITDLTDKAAFRSEAVRIDEELGAFMVIGASDIDFIDEISRRGVLCFCGAQYPESFYQQYAPFAWSTFPSGDNTNIHLAEFIAKRLGVSSTADHAGGPLRGQPRQYGLIYPNSIYAENAADLEQRLAELGIPIRRSASYELVVETGVQQATNIAQQMKQAGVTSILCICDPVAPFFLYNAMKSQLYEPEHIQTGYFYQDTYEAGQFYDQDQYSRNFGISTVLAVRRPNEEDNGAYQVYTSKRPGQPVPLGYGASFSYMTIALLGLERAGPGVDPATFEAGMRTIDLQAANEFEVSISFTTPGSYTPLLDAQEVWWNRNKVAPNDKPGDFENVNGGRRYLPGQWPTAPAVPFRPECLPRGSCGLPG